MPETTTPTLDREHANGATTTESTASSETQERHGGSWLDSALGLFKPTTRDVSPVTVEEPQTDDEPEGEDAEDSRSDDASAAADDETGESDDQSSADGRIWTTREELDKAVAAQAEQLAKAQLARQVQAEVDRREAKRKASDAEEARKRLRKEDPYAYVEQEEQTEAERQRLETEAERTQTTFRLQAQQFDRALLDPLFKALPPEAQEALRSNPPVGMSGREKAVTWAIDVMQKDAVERAKATLRKNTAFRKELLAELRDEMGDSPDLAPAAATPRAPEDMTSIIRGFARSIGVT